MVLMIGTPGFGWFSTNNNNVWSMDEQLFRVKRELYGSLQKIFQHKLRNFTCWYKDESGKCSHCNTFWSKSDELSECSSVFIRILTLLYLEAHLRYTNS